MNYLPDDPNKKEAMRAGLLQFGAAMLGGRGNFGQHLGQGLSAGAQGYQGTIQQAQKDQLEAAQLKLLQGKEQRATNMQNMISSAFGGGGMEQPGGAATSGQPTPGAGMPPGGGVTPRAGQFPLSLNQVSQIKAMGGPDLSSEYKMANEGFKREQGATYDMPDGSRRSFAKLDNGQMQGDDGSIMSAPGYDDTMAATEGRKAGAIAQAKSKYELLPLGYVGEDGRPIGGTTGGYIGKVAPVRDLPKIGGTPPARAPMKTAGPAGFPVVTPAEQNKRDGTRLEILQQERARMTDPREIAIIDREINGTRGAAPVLQSAAQAKAQIGAVDKSLSAGTKLNDNWITSTLNPVQTEGKAAKSTLSQLQTIRNVDFNTGWGAPTMAKAAAVLGSLGVKDAEKYASQAQSFQQVAKERLMTTLQAQVGPQTEGDAQRAEATFMQLGNTPAANQLIADLAEAQANIAVKKAEYYSNALPFAQQKGDLTEIDRRWSKIAPSVWSDPKLSKYKAK
jgi:hypothetical protein